MRLDLHPVLDLARARRHEHARALDLAHADAAGVDRRERALPAHRRDLDALALRDVEDRLVLARRDGLAVERELDGAGWRAGPGPAHRCPPVSKTSSLRSADSIASAAVWPSPQIDASRIEAVISSSSAYSCSTDPRGRPFDEPGERLLLADGADPARHALAARLVAEERGEPHEDGRQVDGVVDHHHDAGAHADPGLPRRLERHLDVELVGRDEAPGRAAQQDRAQRPPVEHAAAELEHLAQRDPERRLVEAGPRDPARQAEQARARRVLGADLRVRLAALHDDAGHVDERLDVVDHRRLVEQALVDRERRLVARLAAVALDRVEQRGLLAADVGAGALAQLDVERETLAEDVLAQVAAGTRRR